MTLGGNKISLMPQMYDTVVVTTYAQYIVQSTQLGMLHVYVI